MKKEQFNIPFIYISFVFGVITVFLVNAFLSGKIIDISKGTSEGGIISASGVAVILVVMVLAGFVILVLVNRREKLKKMKKDKFLFLS